MERQRSRSKSFGGLVRKVVAPSLLMAAVGFLPAGNANAGYISPIASGFSGVSDNSVRLYHVDGANDNYVDGEDTPYSSREPPAINFFSEVQSYDLSRDKRGLDSISTFHTLLQGNDLTYPATGNLTFLINGGTDFPENIWADIYKNNVLDTGNIDVRDAASKGTTYNLSLASNSDVYKIDVRFVPEGGTLGMLGSGALAVGAFGLYNLITRRKEEEPKE